MAQPGFRAAIALSLAALPVTADAATVFATGTYGANDAISVNEGVNLGPGRYRFYLTFTTPVDNLFGYPEKSTVTSFFCNDQDGTPEYSCGGSDVPTQPLFEPVGPGAYAAPLKVDPAFSQPALPENFMRYEQFDICCTVTFSADTILPGSYTLSFAAVPEPATWLMLIVGVGAVGMAMRRRKRHAVA